MQIIVTESQFNYLIEGVKDTASVDAILVGGLDTRRGDYNINQQVNLLKNGLGSDKNIKGFRYNASTSQILDFINKNPQIPIFLFSAGCSKAYELSSSPNVDKKNLFIIEPYAKSDRVKRVIKSAVSNGVPSRNVFVGNNVYRGAGVVNGAVSSNSSSHWGALQKVGSMKSNVAKSSGEVVSNDIYNTKDFQTWLDKNHPGWHMKFGTLDNKIIRGYGIRGKSTKRAWDNLEWRREYLASKSYNTVSLD